MKFPKLKNAMLCRILTYVTVLGAFVVPAVAVISIKAIPVLAKGLFAFAMGACLLAYMFRNFTVLLSLDVILAGIHCYNTARKQFDISGRRSIRSIEKRVARFGKKCEAAPISPQPDVLRYRFHFPVTVYSKGIEKVVAVYHTDFLDKECYRAIFRSAQTNSKSLIGKKKAILLDKNQKSSPLNRVTVVFIFAARVESQFAATLYDTLCKQDGDGYEEAFLPCIIDVQNYICVFN
ncbi:MAG: hypothetical protein IJW22_07050, partial [Clostridia bacterium]|nr:hypothetical protein [Clostridia bacterium]